MNIYLCYDVKGIQSFIFKIPKLQCIIGGSALIDQFDRETMKNIKQNGCEHIYSAGGKGAFVCNSLENLEELKKNIIYEAYQIGLDIQFGQEHEFYKASLKHHELYPFVPSNLEGEPCRISGLYPVNNEKDSHDVVNKRNNNNRWFENRFLKEVTVIPGLKDRQEFFRNVNANDDEQLGGKAGAEAIGFRNRWALICMDGNDMGKQFLKKQEMEPDEKKMIEWIKIMSSVLDNCSEKATIAGIQQVIREWHNSEKTGLDPSKIVLPVRPIIVGGDDIVILCHSSYARTFVKETIRVFNEISLEEEKKEFLRSGQNLWPALERGKGLTISAGILYCSVSLPLHTVINYAETLLANAKQRGRKEGCTPSPACIDWEHLTETVIDTPAARRNRESVFYDNDIKETIRLTKKPYTFNDFEVVEDLAKVYKKIPRSMRHKVINSIRQGYYDRLAFVAEIMKNSKSLAEHLCEYPDITKSRWKRDDGNRVTDVVDALLLVEEEERMTKETANV
jgi:hypothetical protein